VEPQIDTSHAFREYSDEVRALDGGEVPLLAPAFENEVSPTHAEAHVHTWLLVGLRECVDDAKPGVLFPGRCFLCYDGLMSCYAFYR
jgi:hypothetical protein